MGKQDTHKKKIIM